MEKTDEEAAHDHRQGGKNTQMSKSSKRSSSQRTHQDSDHVVAVCSRAEAQRKADSHAKAVVHAPSLVVLA